MRVEVTAAELTRPAINPEALRRAEQLMRDRRKAAQFIPLDIAAVPTSSSLAGTTRRADISRVREYMDTAHRPKHTKPALAALAALHNRGTTP